tara:strand:+ start:2202 stop:2861 length:660 start_codon:yes stop_codon:yes gene_type:complete
MEFKSISYAITVCNEIEEFNKLYPFLRNNINLDDEIIVQQDLDNSSDEDIYNIQSSLIDSGGDVFEKKPPTKYIQYPLGNNFSAFKNNLKKHCSKEYIFQIDADELPALELIINLPGILSVNDHVDLFHVPRCNTVFGLTQDHVNKWGWSVNGAGLINWPDWQPRIIKNKPEIKWTLPVHETITGHSSSATLPELRTHSLMHDKRIEKQEKQNAFYETL